DGLKEVSSIQPALSKVSKIAKLSHTSTTFAEKLENIGNQYLKRIKHVGTASLIQLKKYYVYHHQN
ncbi:MAG: hypothetical protein LH629_13560, partial [Ignavibacteria bacterium]|nr:hypothetical protein [Ignavibacteria bacterium]